MLDRRCATGEIQRNMAEQPAFFDLQQKPTSRTIALRVREAGAAVAMDEALRRADAASSRPEAASTM